MLSFNQRVASQRANDIHTHWALRFDGWTYREQTRWSDEERLRVTDRAVEELVLPAEDERGDARRRG